MKLFNIQLTKPTLPIMVFFCASITAITLFTAVFSEPSNVAGYVSMVFAVASGAIMSEIGVNLRNGRNSIVVIAIFSVISASLGLFIGEFLASVFH